MHEMSVASSLLGALLEATTDHGEGRVVSATLRLGTLSCINLDALTFGFEALSHGTRAEGCIIDVEWVPAVGTCHRCGWSGEIDDPYMPPCPECKHCPVAIDGGREITLARATLDES